MQHTSRRLMPWLLLLGYLCSLPVTAAVAVIVHPQNDANLDKTAIARIFLGKTKKLPNGRAVLPLNAAKGSPIRDEFNRLVLGKSSAQVNAYWSKLVFTGKGVPPKELSSDAEVIATVSANEDAIGYVNPAAVTDAVKVAATFE